MYRYIYGGILSLNEQDTSDFFKVLAAADVLCLQELVDYLQKYLIENKSEWIEQNFGFIQQISSQSNNLLKLQEFCTNLIVQSPEKLFNSSDFTSLSENSLVSIIKRDDLQMKEVEVWEHVLKWGIAQNQTLVPDPKTWSKDDFKKMKNTLKNCLPLIRFFCLSSIEFSQNVRPYKKLLNKQLFEDLLNFYLVPNSVSTDNILGPRKIKVNEIKIIDSQIVDSSIASIVSKWVDKVVVNDDNYEESYLPYKFKLLLRGSRDGFTPKKFHELCDGKHNTVTFIKVKGTKEILGGYSPLKWEPFDVWGETKDSFIFSFKDNNVKDTIISNVENTDRALYNYSTYGPCFGDIIIYANTGESNDYNNIYCKKRYYEKKTRDTEDQFSMEDYEVFEITK